MRILPFDPAPLGYARGLRCTRQDKKRKLEGMRIVRILRFLRK